MHRKSYYNSVELTPGDCINFLTRNDSSHGGAAKSRNLTYLMSLSASLYSHHTDTKCAQIYYNAKMCLDLPGIEWGLGCDEMQGMMTTAKVSSANWNSP